jgi:hypothetical protein
VPVCSVAEGPLWLPNTSLEPRNCARSFGPGGHQDTHGHGAHLHLMCGVGMRIGTCVGAQRQGLPAWPGFPSRERPQALLLLNEICTRTTADNSVGPPPLGVPTLPIRTQMIESDEPVREVEVRNGKGGFEGQGHGG